MHAALTAMQLEVPVLAAQQYRFRYRAVNRAGEGTRVLSAYPSGPADLPTDP
jgi:hypothetical protein